MTPDPDNPVVEKSSPSDIVEKSSPSYRNDLSNGPELALTKAQHDAIVEAKGRSYTDQEIRPRQGNNGAERI